MSGMSHHKEAKRLLLLTRHKDDHKDEIGTLGHSSIAFWMGTKFGVLALFVYFYSKGRTTRRSGQQVRGRRIAQCNGDVVIAPGELGRGGKNSRPSRVMPAAILHFAHAQTFGRWGVQRGRILAFEYGLVHFFQLIFKIREIVIVPKAGQFMNGVGFR